MPTASFVSDASEYCDDHSAFDDHTDHTAIEDYHHHYDNHYDIDDDHHHLSGAKLAHSPPKAGWVRPATAPSTPRSSSSSTPPSPSSQTRTPSST